MAHSAVLLVGGKSTRMGRDKAALVVNGKTLWQHQLETLRATGPAEILVSGPSDGPYRDCGCRVVSDVRADSGPLAGIASALEVCTTDLLLVLAVDLPNMTGEFLAELARQSKIGIGGVVPIHADGKWEPLAAVYPERAVSIASALVREGRLKLSSFIAELESRGWIERRMIGRGETDLFRNWNTPGDLPPSV